VTNRVLLGSTVSGRYGLRVSKPGFDVTDPGLTGQQLSFESEWASTARLHASGSVSVPEGTGGFTSVYFSALPVFPAVIAYLERGGVTRPIQVGNTIQSGGWADDFAYTPMRIYPDHLDFRQMVGPNGAYTAHYIVMAQL
jgi:hypothetical protein